MTPTGARDPFPRDRFTALLRRLPATRAWPGTSRVTSGCRGRAERPSSPGRRTSSRPSTSCRESSRSPASSTTRSSCSSPSGSRWRAAGRPTASAPRRGGPGARRDRRRHADDRRDVRLARAAGGADHLADGTKAVGSDRSRLGREPRGARRTRGLIGTFGPSPQSRRPVGSADGNEPDEAASEFMAARATELARAPGHPDGASRRAALRCGHRPARGAPRRHACALSGTAGAPARPRRGRAVGFALVVPRLA